jgi:hypothetical protein
MAPLSSAGSAASRPLVIALFAASCLLSLVSWYTTQQGMALYLSPWFAVLASLGIQISLVMVAWLIGFSKAKRALLIAVYAITAVVSISFSYVSLYTWFSARERPATIERGLYDRLSTAATQADETLQAAIGEGKRHVLALQEMTESEKAHGYISRAQDSDPYLANIRESVAKEAQSYSSGYKEGSGLGLRYTAFDRYEKLTRESLAQIEQARGAMAAFRATTKPTDPSDKQLKSFREAYDQVPWAEVEKTIHTGKLARPELPSYADNVDKTASQQEDLMVAFTELLTNPGGRHIFSLALAAFIDIVVFLLAYSSGPLFLRCSGTTLVRGWRGAGCGAVSDLCSRLPEQAEAGPAGHAPGGLGGPHLRRTTTLHDAGFKRHGGHRGGIGKELLPAGFSHARVAARHDGERQFYVESDAPQRSRVGLDCSLRNAAAERVGKRLAPLML